MARKKSVRKAASDFRQAALGILKFAKTAQLSLSDEHISWAYDYAIIRLYREFESLMLKALVGALNHDLNTLSQRTGIKFPKHLTDEVCEFLVVGTGYFDFKGRDGLIRTLKKFVPEKHYLIKVVMKPKYKDTLEKLSILRNYAAHGSEKSKRALLEGIGQTRIGSSGAWLKRGERFKNIVDRLRELAQDIRNRTSY